MMKQLWRAFSALCCATPCRRRLSRTTTKHGTHAFWRTSCASTRTLARFVLLHLMLCAMLQTLGTLMHSRQLPSCSKLHPSWRCCPGS